jgi:3-deoxy-D-manno-octulosonic acid kinase
MAGVEFKAGSGAIVYDGELLPVASIDWLQPKFWQIRGSVMGELGGRGQALVVETPSGPAVLRRYLRGGQIRRISVDRYLFTGFSSSRGFREWRVLDHLHKAGLPVPRPLAASCERAGLTYRAGLLTRLIPGARSLLELAPELNETSIGNLAEVLQRFFATGLVHRDLNATNILLDQTGQWYLIDFDRATIRPGASRPGPMVRRLQRSLIRAGFDDQAESIGAQLDH